MASGKGRRPLLRSRDTGDGNRVGFVELFFDLVFVYAVTQLSHGLLHHFTWTGLAETAFLMLAIWWVWVYTAWVTNWLDPESNVVRLLLFVLMLAGLVLSISLPDAFGERGLVFACAYTFMQVGRSLFMCGVLRGRNHGNYHNFLRITTWLSLSGVLWIAGGMLHHDARYILWGAALTIEYLSPAFGFWTPGLGRSKTAVWDVSGAHLAERCALFIIIALGESLLVTGATFAELPWSPITITAFLTAYTCTVAVWWIYFSTSAERASEKIAACSDPGWIARLAYTYLHLPIVAGIILSAVADEFVLAQPGGDTTLLAASAIIGGPTLFLAGNLFFRWSIFGRFARAHLAGIVVLLVLLTSAALFSPLVLAACATIVMVTVGACECYGHDESLVEVE